MIFEGVVLMTSYLLIGCGGNIKNTLSDNYVTEEEDKQRREFREKYMKGGEKFIETFCKDAIQSLSNKKKKNSKNITDYFATEKVGKNVTGEKYWVKINETEKKKFIELIVKHISYSFLKIFKLNISTINSNRARKSGDKITVYVKINGISSIWYLLTYNNTFKILEISIDDLNLVQSLKAQFSSDIEKKGNFGKFLIDYEKNVKLLEYSLQK